MVSGDGFACMGHASARLARGGEDSGGDCQAHCHSVWSLCFVPTQTSPPPNRFEVIDADDVASVLRLDIPFNKLYVDLSGSRPPGVVLDCVEHYSAVFDLDLVVIKNVPLKRFMQQALHPP